MSSQSYLSNYNRKIDNSSSSSNSFVRTGENNEKNDENSRLDQFDLEN